MSAFPSFPSVAWFPAVLHPTLSLPSLVSIGTVGDWMTSQYGLLLGTVLWGVGGMVGISAGFTLVSFTAVSVFWFPAVHVPCSAADCGAPVPVSVKAFCSIVHFISWLVEQSVPALAVPLVVAVSNGLHGMT